MAMISLALLSGCQGGGSNSNSTTPSGGDDATDKARSTWVVGIPYVQGSQTGQQFYNDLFNRLNSNSLLSANQILLDLSNPVSNNIFSFGSSISNSGYAIQFLNSVALESGSISIFMTPDVESSSIEWGQWQIPDAAKNIPSCVQAQQQSSTPSYAWVLKSICWSSYANQFIAAQNPGKVINNPIRGVAYDTQGFILSDESTNLQWIQNQTKADNLKLGWISGGVKTYVDVNFIEVYDIFKRDVPNAAFDTMANDAVLKLTENDPMCTDPAGCSYSFGFPGLQWTYPDGVDKNNHPIVAAGVGADIYQCALNAGSSNVGCSESYTQNIDTSATLSDQIMQSLNYIYNQQVKSPALSAGVLGVPPANTSLVYLFSTQYHGPYKSTYKSNTQCLNGGSCSCVASAYNSAASCGDENGFGSWINNRDQYLSFVTKFLVQ